MLSLRLYLAALRSFKTLLCQNLHSLFCGVVFIFLLLKIVQNFRWLRLVTISLIVASGTHGIRRADPQQKAEDSNGIQYLHQIWNQLTFEFQNLDTKGSLSKVMLSLRLNLAALLILIGIFEIIALRHTAVVPVKKKKRLLLGLVKSRADLSVVKFVFFQGPTCADSTVYDLDDYNSLLHDSKFDNTKETVLYLHGYLEDPDVESVRVIADAYLHRKDINIIVLDWGKLADGNYTFDAVVNLKQLGPPFAEILKAMFDNGLDLGKFHLVGHSLGAQLAGIIGREIYRHSYKTIKLKRITGLDPAAPLFYMGCLTKHLNREDAEFVDVIHTDACIYGAPVSTGTVDFWPNGGETLQPGCPKRNYKMLSDNDLSSHRRSWWYWAESVANMYPDKFNAVKANSWSDFKNGNGSYDSQVVMGHDCPTDISGDYYLQTNCIWPYARGKHGTAYVDPKELDCHTDIYAKELVSSDDGQEENEFIDTIKPACHRVGYK